MPPLTQPTPIGPPRHAVRASGRHRWARGAALSLVAVVTFSATGAVAAYRALTGNVTSVGALDGLIAMPSATATTDAPPADEWAGRAVTFAVLGSDDRSGENGSIGGFVAGMRSDTTFLVHVSADRRRVEVVSIPRDSEVEIPACHLDRDPDGPVSEPVTDKFNAAFAIGAETGDLGLAAACTLSTIAVNTGVQVSDFAIVDLAGFEGMVDAIGGVQVCVPTAIRDTKGNTELDLSAGWHDLAGPEALDYVRARYVTGTDNSDTQRIARQQKFVGALVRKVLSADVLTSPRSLAQFLLAATGSLTTSDGLTTRVAGMALSLRSLDPSSVTFVTVPWGSGTHGRIAWTPDADDLWERLVADESITGTTPEPEVAQTLPGSADEPTTDPGAPVAPASPIPTGAAVTTPPVAGVSVQTGVDPDDESCG